MSHQDRSSAIVINHKTLKQAIDWLFPAKLFAGIRLRQGALWTPRTLAVAAVLWAMSDLNCLTRALGHALAVIPKICRHLPKPAGSYQSFIKCLNKYHVELLLAVEPHIQMQMREVLPGQWKIAGFVVFAADGSRVELPRTKELEAAFSPQTAKKAAKRQRKGGKRGSRKKPPRKKKKQSAASVKKKQTSPQMWLTLLWHVGSGLPWCWQTGPSDSSERAHLQEMLAKTPHGSLITADAGFVGYEFWQGILDAGRHFLTRVGGNVKLLRNLGYGRTRGNTVYLWPDKAAKQRQPPLVLRLIELHDGKQPVYLVTDLTPSQLSDRQAADIYTRRWGIELYFRTFKQTFGRRKLRGRTPETVQFELDWSMVALWMVCLLGQRELAEGGLDPRRLSAVRAIRAVQEALRDYRVRPERWVDTLWSRLAVALLDDYERSSSKTSRNYPRKKHRQGCGAPQIREATEKQINAAKKLSADNQQIRLTA